MQQTFAALADANRYRMVELLRSGGRPVSEIAQRVRMGQPQVSKHLRVLKDAGLVEVEARGQQRIYALRAKPLRDLHDWLERYRTIWEARFDALDELVQTLEKPHARRK